MSNITLPVLADSSLSQYLAQIHKFPMLAEDEEFILAKSYAEHQDMKAAEKLVTSHLRLVVKIAGSFRGYGLPAADLIAEGNIGLMQAVKKFDPDKGFRLSTYAMWWIKASINEYVLRSWSLVKMGTSAAQKKLFYNLRRMKKQIDGAESRNLLPGEVSQIAHDLDVPERDVVEMDERLGAYDSSLNRSVSNETDSDEMINFISDDDITQEDALAETQVLQQRRKMLALALKSLNDRERDIILRRQLQEPAITLEELSQCYGVSRERIRQIESRAMEKLQAEAQKTIKAIH